MSDQTPDPTELARRYLDLWQKQMSGMAADPEMGRLAARSMELAVENARLFAAAAGGGAAGTDADVAKSAGGPGRDGARESGAASAASAHDDLGRRLDRLSRRVAALEKRIAVLEGGDPGRDRGAGKKPRSRRS